AGAYRPCIAFRMLVAMRVKRRRLLLVVDRSGVDCLAILCLQKIIGEAENLEAIPITDDPQIELVALAIGRRHFDEAREARLLLDGPIYTRRPATRTWKERRARRRTLP